MKVGEKTKEKVNERERQTKKMRVRVGTGVPQNTKTFGEIEPKSEGAMETRRHLNEHYVFANDLLASMSMFEAPITNLVSCFL